MIAFRILTTIFISISILTSLIKNVSFVEEIDVIETERAIAITWIWSMLWRAFVIVSVWVI